MAISKIKVDEIEHELQTTVSNITDLTATATELNYVDGVTSPIQTQLDGKAATHTHPYAGSASQGGAANYALKMQTYYQGDPNKTYGTQYSLYAQWYTNDRLKLITDNYPTEVDHSFKLVSSDISKTKATAPLAVGSVNQPVYFSGGVPVSCTGVYSKAETDTAIANAIGNAIAASY